MKDMATLPTLTVIEESQVSPPPATVGERSLTLTFFDFIWLNQHPAHTLFFYDLPITRNHFTETILPNLKRSLSITLQHFFSFAGNLIIFPTTASRKPEIRYVEGDYVAFTFAETNLDFNDLTGNHPRECDQFYQLIPLLGDTTKVSDYIMIPMFSVQVTLFPNYGISIGYTNHHSLGDANTMLSFKKAWTCIAKSGSDESFLANGTLPIYDRLIVNPKLDESYLKVAKIETFLEDYQLPRLSGPTDKVRGTFILTATITNQLKKFVLSQLPTLACVSSFTVACAYIWSCIAKSRNDELEFLGFAVDCRSRLDPPIPVGYFGNCVEGCKMAEKTALLIGKEGFLAAAKLIGENLLMFLTDKNGILKDAKPFEDFFPDGIMPTTIIGVAGSPKLKFYELDFGFGKPKKHEYISIDYSQSISISACKESKEDMEIGVCLPATEMKVFVHTFNHGLETYI